MTSGIGGDAALNYSRMLQGFGTGQTRTVDSTQNTAGNGAVGGAGQTPDVLPANTMNAVMQSVFAMIPAVTGQMLDVLLLEVTTKMKETIDKSEKDKIDTDTNAKRVQIGEKQQKMEEATRKIEEAENKMKNMSVWDKIKLAFQYIGAILSIIAGVVAMVAGIAAGAFTGGATAIAGMVGGVALIASGVMMLGMAADATYAVTNKDGLGFIGAMVKQSKMDAGMSEEDALKEATKADMIARIVVGVVAALLAVGGGIATGPLMGKALISTALGITSAINSAASATGDLVVGVLKYEAQEERAEGLEKKAEAKAMEAVIQSLEDMIDMAMTRLKGANQRFDAMLDSLTDAIKDKGDTMARARFSA